MHILYTLACTCLTHTLKYASHIHTYMPHAYTRACMLTYHMSIFTFVDTICIFTCSHIHASHMHGIARKCASHILTYTCLTNTHIHAAQIHTYMPHKYTHTCLTNTHIHASQIHTYMPHKYTHRCLTHTHIHACSQAETINYDLLKSRAQSCALQQARYHATTRCNIMQHTATQSIATYSNPELMCLAASPVTRCSTLQYAATRCNTLQYTAMYCNRLQYNQI